MFFESDEYSEEDSEQIEEEFTLNKKKFDKNSFDYKVAKSIVKIHRIPKEKTIFSNWVDKNFKHLHNLYMMSGVTVTMEEFFNFVFDHSKQ